MTQAAGNKHAAFNSGNAIRRRDAECIGAEIVGFRFLWFRICRIQNFIALSDNVPDRLPTMSDGNWATGAVREHHMRIDAQLLINCRNNVSGRDGV